jgi:hypothetical protein
VDHHVLRAVNEVDGACLFLLLSDAVYASSGLLDGVSRENVHDDDGRACTLQVEAGCRCTRRADENLEFLRSRVSELADGVPALLVSYAGAEVADTKAVHCSSEGGDV